MRLERWRNADDREFATLLSYWARPEWERAPLLLTSPTMAVTGLSPSTSCEYDKLLLTIVIAQRLVRTLGLSTLLLGCPTIASCCSVLPEINGA